MKTTTGILDIMLATTHVITSIPLGIHFSNPLVIFFTSCALHFVLDSLLHWNIYPQKFKRYPYGLVGLDIASGIVVGWFAIGNQLFTLPILIAITGGLAPDILHGLWFIAKPRTRNKYLKWMDPFFKFHDKVQKETHNIAKGIIWQIIVISVALIAMVI